MTGRAARAVAAVGAWVRVPPPLAGVFGLVAYHGYALAATGAAAPWLGASLGLDEAALARLFGWISVSALGSFVLARLMDRIGRRRVMRACVVVTPLAMVAAAGAPGALGFGVAVTIVGASAGAAVVGASVLAAEYLDREARARGQALAGMAAAGGAAVCLVALPALLALGASWRALYALGGLGVVAAPLWWRSLPETLPPPAAAPGDAPGGRRPSAFDRTYRAHAAPLVVATLLGTGATAAADVWRYFHAVADVGLTAAGASALLIAAGAGGLVGYPLGATSSDRWGRKPTIVLAALGVGSGMAAYFWGPPAGFPAPALWLGLALGTMLTAGNALGVATNCVVTERFPATLRATIFGWFHLAGSVARVASQLAVAVVTPQVGGVAVAVGGLALLLAPVSIIFLVTIDETREPASQSARP